MTTTETLLAAIHEHATADELCPIMYFLGECGAKRAAQTLERFHARLQKLRRTAAPGSWHRGFADAVTAYLDGYFATVESAQRLESLAREVEAQPLRVGDAARKAAAQLRADGPASCLFCTAIRR